MFIIIIDEYISKFTVLNENFLNFQFSIFYLFLLYQSNMEADDNYEVIPTLKIQDVINCKVSNWYELFKDHCLKLDIIKLNKAFIDYLKADGIILPNECINDEDKEEEEEYV